MTIYVEPSELHHRLKASPTEGNFKVLASISVATFSIKRVGMLKLPYPLLFINIHKGTKYPIGVYQNLIYILQYVSGATKAFKF